MVWVAQKSFSFGELDPRIFALSDSRPYQGGCEELTNGIITRYGSARKRYGTGIVGNTYNDQSAVLFRYNGDGDEYVIEISADDSAGTPADARILRVWDVAARALKSAFAAQSYPPFSSAASDVRVKHHFTEAELPDIQAFQHKNRLYLVHKDHPPLYLERVQLPSDELWAYGVAPVNNVTPIVERGPQQIEISLVGGVLEASRDLFTTGDSESLWRVEGPNNDPTARPYGVWVEASAEPRNARQLGASTFYGPVSADFRDPSDFAGPFLPTGTSGTATNPTNSNLQGDVRTFTSSSLSANARRGTPVKISNTYWLVTDTTATDTFTAVRLQGGILVSSGSVTIEFYDLDYSRYAEQEDFAFIFPVRGTNGSGFAVTDLYMDQKVEWLNSDFIATFDTFVNAESSFSVGGSIVMNGGAVALNEDRGVGYAGDGTAYRGVETQRMGHIGPSLWWGKGWNADSGFPRCGTSHQGRVFFGGFYKSPSRVVSSGTNNIDSFRSGPNANDPLNFDVDDPQGGTIQWMQSAKDLFVGTQTSEYVIVGQPITGTEIGLERQTGYGGANRKPLLTSNNVVFVDADGRGLREMGYVFDRDRYKAPDLTDAATHLFEGKEIIRVEQMVAPEMFVATLFSDGTMAALSYRPENGILGWSEWTQPAWPSATNTTTVTSTVESIAAVRQRSGQRDELWMVREFIRDGEANAGSTGRTVEIMSDEFLMDMEADFGTTSTLGAAAGDHTDQYASISSYSYIVADDVYIGIYGVTSGGAVGFSSPPAGYTVAPTTVTVGRPVSFALTPLLAEFSIPGQGDTAGRTRQISTVTVYLNEARGGEVEGKDISGVTIPATIRSEAIDLMQGWQPVFGVGPFGDRSPLQITQSIPYYFEVCAVNCEVDYGSGTE